LFAKFWVNGNQDELLSLLNSDVVINRNDLQSMKKPR
jgi:hypothetical protein